MMPVLSITESAVTAQCREFLSWHGVELHRRNVGGMRNDRGRYVKFGEPGQADYFAIYRGRAIECEFKRTGWRPRGRREREHFAAQVAWLNAINEAGGVGLVIDRLEWLVILWPRVVAGASFRVRDDGTMEET